MCGEPRTWKGGTVTRFTLRPPPYAYIDARPKQKRRPMFIHLRLLLQDILDIIAVVVMCFADAVAPPCEGYIKEKR